MDIKEINDDYILYQLALKRKVKDLRLSYGDSQRAISEKTGISYSQYMRLESVDSEQQITLKMLYRLARYFDIPLTHLIDINK